MLVDRIGRYYCVAGGVDAIFLIVMDLIATASS